MIVHGFCDHEHRMAGTKYPAKRLISACLRSAADGASVKSIIAVEADGEDIRSVEFESDGSHLTFRTRAKEFAYHVLLLEG